MPKGFGSNGTDWLNGVQRHYAGRFTKKVVDYFAEGIYGINIKSDIPGLNVDGILATDPRPPQLPKQVYVVLEDLELGDNPFVEEVNIRFRVVTTKPSQPKEEEPTITWGPAFETKCEQYNPTDPSNPSETVTEPTSGGKALLYFTFTNEISFAENIEDFRDFIKSFVLTAEVPPTETLGISPPP